MSSTENSNQPGEEYLEPEIEKHETTDAQLFIVRVPGLYHYLTICYSFNYKFIGYIY